MCVSSWSLSKIILSFMVNKTLKKKPQFKLVKYKTFVFDEVYILFHFNTELPGFQDLQIRMLTNQFLFFAS